MICLTLDTLHGENAVNDAISKTEQRKLQAVAHI